MLGPKAQDCPDVISLSELSVIQKTGSKYYTRGDLILLAEPWHFPYCLSRNVN
jgi:hypothetical protein